jgi:glucosylceramidase
MLCPGCAQEWMKAHDSLNGGRLRDDRLSSYAMYLTLSLKAYEATGIPIKYLTVQNEPLYDTPNYPGIYMPASQAAELIGKHLGPEFKQAEITTRILAYDHNWDHPEYPLSLLSDPSVSPYLAGSALHCYGGDVKAQSEIHQKFPDMGIWMTECSGGTWDKQPALVKTARLLIESTRNWSKAVSLWGLVLDSDHNPHSGGCGTCRGLVTLDLHASTPTVSYTGDFYALGHASKFVKPGAVRIASPSYGEVSLQTVAFQNLDHSIVLVALNNLNRSTSFRIEWAGKELVSSIEPSTLATYIWQP